MSDNWPPALLKILMDERYQHTRELADARDRLYTERGEWQSEALEKALTAVKEATTAALTSTQRASDLAEANAEKWRGNANEWRAAMSDRERNFIPRSEHESIAMSLSREITDLKARLDRSEGTSSGITKGWGYIVGALGVGAAIVAAAEQILRHS